MRVRWLFGTLQMGYNPNRERVFLFANLKTSRYDTVASRYQREMKEYQQKSLLKGNNENRAYVSKRWEMASVLIEKKENKPWTRYSIQTYLGRNNMEAIQKTMPFFMKAQKRNTGSNPGEPGEIRRGERASKRSSGKFDDGKPDGIHSDEKRDCTEAFFKKT